MVADMGCAIDVAKRAGLPLYCGEFGVIALSPSEVRLAWLRDVISLFDEFGIGWANWDYKSNDFGIVDGNGESTGLAEAMLSSTLH
jgi:endoglucanase